MITKQELKSHLWESANILRGKIDSGDFKHYILSLLFYKRLSDVFDEEYEKIKEKVGEEMANDPNLYAEVFFIPEGCHWNDILSTSTNMGDKINDVFVNVTRANSPRLDGILDKIDFADKDRLSDSAVKSLVNHFNSQRLGNDDVTGDMLGDAYEYLIAQFADDAGKKGGEFYTPHKVVELIVDILQPEEGDSIYDPACGSGGMLVTCADYLKKKGKNSKRLFLYGQESVYNTYILAKMNMILHGYNDAKIERGDTFSDPKHLENGALKQFDLVLANPPWNLDDWLHTTETVKGKKKKVDKEDKFNRLIYGRPPASTADWAWIQHMLASLNDNGRVGVVMDNGVLFRGSKEGQVRKAFVENDLIDSVIGLPSNLFANTGSPGCILILSKNKPQERTGKILFIDASKDYLEGKAQNHLRSQDVEKTLRTYDEYNTVERYCSVCELEEIEENDFNLNISRYVDTTEPEVPVNIQDVLRELETLEKTRDENKSTLNDYLNELGY
ncbi:MAG: type I restriction-modification system subunit M [Flavobacteriales bacterium]